MSHQVENEENFLQHNHGPEGNIANRRHYDRGQYLINGIQSHAKTGTTLALSMVIPRTKFSQAHQTTKDISNMRSRFYKEIPKSLSATEILLLLLQ